MGIRDRDVRDALETLETEIENFEATIKSKDEEIEELTEEVSGLKSQVEEYEERIKELEDALAEAYLTSEQEQEHPGKVDQLQSGPGTDVSNPADDKATNG